MKEKIFYTVVVAIILATTIFTFYYFYHYKEPYANKNIMDISDNWSFYNDGQYHKVNYIWKLNKEILKDPITLSRKLQKIDGLQTLMIKNNHNFIQIFLDNKLLFENSQDRFGKNPGSGLYFISLPENYDGKMLKIIASSPYEMYKMRLKPIYLGDIPSLYAFILHEGAPYLFILFSCTVSGFFFIIYSMFSYIKERKHLDSLCFGIFSVLWGVYCIGSCDITRLIFSPKVASLMIVGLYSVYYIPLFLFFHLNFRTCKKVTLGVIIALCITAVTVYVLQLFSIVDFPEILPILNYFVIVYFSIMVFVGIIEFRQGNELLRFLSLALILLILTGISTITEEFLPKYRIKSSYGMRFYIISIFIFIVYIWIYNIREILRQRADEKGTIKLLQLKNELTLNRFNKVKSYIEDIHILRHEIKHHIAAMQILCNDGELSRLSEYLSSISTGIISQDITYSNNHLVDCILSDFTVRSNEYKIQFEYDISIPEKINISDQDLCSLLLNMLDNALESCINSQDKFIKFQMIIKGSFLLITCQNSHNNFIYEKNGKFFTQKQNKISHGHGINIMKSVAEKYGSILDISYDINSFTVKTFLQI